MCPYRPNKDDMKFIGRTLSGIPVRFHRALMECYRRAWEDAQEAETCFIKKENAGRRAANSFLLTEREKYFVKNHR